MQDLEATNTEKWPKNMSTVYQIAEFLNIKLDYREMTKPFVEKFFPRPADQPEVYAIIEKKYGRGNK